MLDFKTRKRIDDCRDILVGKLPDPKAQIEQITIALIYKFMDDMDKEAVELGGKAKFFADYKVPDPQFPNDRRKDLKVEFSKYAWDNLLDPKVSATEMLKLYSDAIERMEKNPNIPQLFRDIFSNAYLPYRDPETLKLFLKTIAGFEYTHSENLGDAFEYLLSVMGSQGDAGQFRTPRHLIDFLVAIIDPDKNDTVLDPACGTAGFLISAYKHILLKYTKGNNEGLNIYKYNKLETKSFNNLGDLLTPADRRRLIQNFVGYDISPDMVRLSRVNLYLHGFSTPDINEYDTLSSADRWDENYDVILANPPFMSPKGGIRPHKKFSIQSNRSEVLFVDYIAEHINSKGRAGIIVPEGVIFQSGTAYKDLRKLLLENHLYAVVSLPAGVFFPYSGVKTSILLLDKSISKQLDEILFVKIDNDGFNLGAQRTAVKGSQLEEAIALIHAFARSHDRKDSSISHLVKKSEIANDGEYSLNGERYRSDSNFKNSKAEIVELDNVATLEYGFTESALEDGDARFIRITDISESGQLRIDSQKYIKLTEESEQYLLKKEDILVARTGATFGKTLLFDSEEKAVFASFLIRINLDRAKVLPKYYWAFAQSDVYWNQARQLVTGGGQPQFNGNALKKLKIPVPPLNVQEEIVVEIDGYQKIIQGAKAVVKNYKPNIDIDPEWEVLELGDIISTQSGGTPSKSVHEYWEGTIPWVSPKDMKVDFIADAEDHISEAALKDSATKLVPAGSILIVVRSGILKHTLPIAMTLNPVAFNQDIIAIQSISTNLSQKYLFYYLISTSEKHIKNGIKPGVTVQSFHNGYFKELTIPIPAIAIQEQIVMQIEEEQKLINANRQLIEIFDKKIKERMAKVWRD